MPVSDKDFKKVLETLEEMKKKLPNGELKIIQEKIERINDHQKEMRDDIASMRKKLFSPEDGVIVKLNRNIEIVENHEADRRAFVPRINDIKNDVDDLNDWKRNVTKAIWVVYSSIIALVAKMLFFDE
ncbi:MAG TPA: hypothetical protein DF712_02735 [Balneola sp.]|nr:hypothetical protein [Balneola sp.]